jgi:HMG box factor
MPVGQEACKTVARPILPMSAIQDSSLLPPLHPPPNWIPPIQVQPPALSPAPEPGRIIFTRQLWQRTMPEDSSEHGVSTRSQSQGSLSAYQANASISRRGSSNVSTRSLRSAPSPTRKRSVNVVEEEDREIDSHEVTPVHTRASSGDSTAHVCICQPDPKIPRPRNGKCPR